MRMRPRVLALYSALAAIAAMPQTPELREKAARTKRRIKNKFHRGGNNKPSLDRKKRNRRNKLARISRRINRKVARG